jgi:hemerythrin
MAQEECLQIVHDYPGYLTHKVQHYDFIRNFGKLEQQLNALGTTPDLLIRTNMTFVSWLTRHFTWADKDLASFLHKARPKQ